MPYSLWSSFVNKPTQISQLTFLKVYILNRYILLNIKKTAKISGNDDALAASEVKPIWFWSWKLI